MPVLKVIITPVKKVEAVCQVHEPSAANGKNLFKRGADSGTKGGEGRQQGQEQDQRAEEDDREAAERAQGRGTHRDGDTEPQLTCVFSDSSVLQTPSRGKADHSLPQAKTGETTAVQDFRIDVKQAAEVVRRQAEKLGLGPSQVCYKKELPTRTHTQPGPRLLPSPRWRLSLPILWPRSE